MNYTTLTPEVFFNDSGGTSFEYLSHYCQLFTTNKFIYDGYISGFMHPDLKFNNIVKLYGAQITGIPNQFPDLIEAELINYWVTNVTPMDIGNLQSCTKFSIDFDSPLNKNEFFSFVKKYVKIIDKNTLFINGKKLKVNKFWRIGEVTNNDYKLFGL